MSSFNGRQTHSSKASWAARGKKQLTKLIPKNNTSNDSRKDDKLQDNTPLSLRDELAESHRFNRYYNRPSTDDAKNESNAANRVRRRRLEEGRHENVRRPNSNKV